MKFNFKKTNSYLALLFPLGTVIAGTAPHFSKLHDHVVASHLYWYDALIHIYLSFERFETLIFNRSFLDYRWFYPYPNSGSYNEPAITNGLLFGFFNKLVSSEVLSFNISMICILFLNALALYLLILRNVKKPAIASIFATLGALSPFMWVRYFHPANTIIFWGILGIFFLQKAVIKPSWKSCLAAPVMFLFQLYSSLYTSMFFVVVLIVMIPHALLKARFTQNLKMLIVRMGTGVLIVIPFIIALQHMYVDTRYQLGKKYSYEYVSNWIPKETGDYIPESSPVCKMQLAGISKKQKDCRDELFPGYLVLLVCALGIVTFFVLAFKRMSKKKLRFFIIRTVAVLSGVGLSLAVKATWPFHLGVIFAGLWPFSKISQSPFIKSPVTVFVLIIFLIIDVSVNPVFELFNVKLASVHQIFFYIIPGYDGLRSEYRIVVLLPVFLAYTGAILTRRFVLFLSLKNLSIISTIVISALFLITFFEAQPAWQEYKKAYNIDSADGVLKTASDLPDDKIIAFVYGRGDTISWRPEHVGAYWANYILLHGHRQVTAKSTYMTPASNAITWTASMLKKPAMRLPWATRLAYMAGATHLIIEWKDKAPSLQIINEMAKEISAHSRVLDTDKRMALIELNKIPYTAHGFIKDKKIPGKIIDTEFTVSSNRPLINPDHATDKDPATFMTVSHRQRVGDFVEFTSKDFICTAGFGFSPGLLLEGLPVGYQMEVFKEDSWHSLKKISRWEIPEALIKEPRTGKIVVPFKSIKGKRFRIKILFSSVFRLNISEIEFYEGKC